MERREYCAIKDSAVQLLHVILGSYEELMLGVKGKGKGKRGRVSKKGGSKVDIDAIMELGYGEC